MIALLTAAWAGSAGVHVGPLAFKGPARHDLRPAIGAWAKAPAGPLQLTGELLGSWRAREALEHRVILGRASAVLGPSTGSERVDLGIALGPALMVRTGEAAGHGFTTLSPAVRVLSHFELNLGSTPLVARYQMGTSMRAIRAWDFDVALGLGARW